MDEKSLYVHILNLTAPGQVKSLSLDENAGSVTVTVGIAENARLACPTCGKSCSVHDVTVIVNGVILIPASSPLLSKSMCPALCAGAWLPDVASSQGWPRKSVYAAVRVVRSLMAENQYC